MKSLLNKKWYLAVITALVLILGSCSAENAATAPELLKPVNAPSDIISVKRGDVRQLSIYEGSAVAFSQALYFRANSVLAEVLVGIGDEVKTGDILAKLDMTMLDAMVEGLTDSLEFNEAMWRNSNAQSEASAARMILAGQTETAAEIRQQLSYDKESQRIERERLTGKIERLEASRDGYIITAPFDGIITHVERILPGAFVMERSTFIWISDMNNITVQSSDAQLRGSISSAERVTADFGSGETPVTRVTYNTEDLIAFRQKKIDPPVVFALENGTFPADKRILLKVYGSSRTDVLTLIPNALHDDTVNEGGVPRHSYFVYLDENGARVRRDVQVGLKSETAVEILSGLEEGDRVYVEEN